MEIEITEQQQENYMDDPNTCPVCGYDVLNAEEFMPDTFSAFRVVTCLKCKHEWEEIFELVRIQNLVKPVEDETLT